MSAKPVKNRKNVEISPAGPKIFANVALTEGEPGGGTRIFFYERRAGKKPG
jgi:hypothetical protein